MLIIRCPVKELVLVSLVSRHYGSQSKWRSFACRHRGRFCLSSGKLGGDTRAVRHPFPNAASGQLLTKSPNATLRYPIGRRAEEG